MTTGASRDSAPLLPAKKQAGAKPAVPGRRGAPEWMIGLHGKPITEAHAREMTDRIKFQMDALWDNIAYAYKFQLHKALGYKRWDDYCAREFGSKRIRVPREEVPETVASLSASGMKIKPMAAATNLDRRTIRKYRPKGGQNDPLSDKTNERADSLGEGRVDPVGNGVDTRADPQGADRGAGGGKVMSAPEPADGDKAGATGARSAAAKAVSRSTPPRAKARTSRPAPISQWQDSLEDTARNLSYRVRDLVGELEVLSRDDRVVEDRKVVEDYLGVHLDRLVDMWARLRGDPSVDPD